MFCDYDTIFFEADDVDECAMRLKIFFLAESKRFLRRGFTTWEKRIKQIFKSGGPLFLFAKNSFLKSTF